MSAELEMPENELYIGALVVNPLLPLWGPGKVAHIRDDMAWVLFRDAPGRAARRFRLERLRLAPSQTDPILDNLPPFVQEGGEFVLPGERLTVQEAIRRFLDAYPGGFRDPAYLGDARHGERNYKWSAHELYVELLGAGQAEQLLASGDVAELAARANRVTGRVNLLALTEAAAFREGLADADAAGRYFTALLALLESAPGETVFRSYAEAVASLPAVGESHTDKWTVATLLPFLARPDTWMFVKPTNTRRAGERLGFELHYDPRPNWRTYEAVLRMSTLYVQLLEDLAPRDLIDIQSFFWVTSRK
ncbi:MAG TPA: hypothetical protein VFZ69_09020 [Longimicrobiales bacterium]